MLKIRLTKTGKKHAPAYRIIVKEQRSKRDGSYIDLIGHWNPSVNPPQLKIDKQKLQQWVQKGAQMTEAVKKLLSK